METRQWCVDLEEDRTAHPNGSKWSQGGANGGWMTNKTATLEKLVYGDQVGDLARDDPADEAARARYRVGSAPGGTMNHAKGRGPRRQRQRRQ